MSDAASAKSREAFRHFVRWTIEKEYGPVQSRLPDGEREAFADYYRRLPKPGDESGIRSYLRGFWRSEAGWTARWIGERAAAIGRRPRVMDAGSGFGTYSMLYAAVGADVVGADLRPDRLDAAQKRLEFHHEVTGETLPVRYARSDLTREWDGDYDLVWVYNALSHIDPLEAFLGQVRAHLAPGGVLVVGDINGAHPEHLARLQQLRGDAVHQEYVAPDGQRHDYAVERPFPPARDSRDPRAQRPAHGAPRALLGRARRAAGVRLPGVHAAAAAELAAGPRHRTPATRRRDSPHLTPDPSFRMRVLFLTQYFPPETGAAPARALHLARALRRAGHEVRVVTGLPNHPSGVIRPEYLGARSRQELVDGVPVRRVWLYATSRKTPITRLWNHLSFALWALGPALFGPRPDVVLVTTPPLFHGLTAWLAARLRGAVLVNDCRDDWPHAAVALGEMRPGFVARALDGVARFFQRRAARILVVTPGMRRQIGGARLRGATAGVPAERRRHGAVPAARNGSARARGRPALHRDLCRDARSRARDGGADRRRREVAGRERATALCRGRRREGGADAARRGKRTHLLHVRTERAACRARGAAARGGRLRRDDPRQRLRRRDHPGQGIRLPCVRLPGDRCGAGGCGRCGRGLRRRHRGGARERSCNRGGDPSPARRSRAARATLRRGSGIRRAGTFARGARGEARAHARGDTARIPRARHRADSLGARCGAQAGVRLRRRVRRHGAALAGAAGRGDRHPFRFAGARAVSPAPQRPRGDRSSSSTSSAPWPSARRTSRPTSSSRAA